MRSPEDVAAPQEAALQPGTRASPLTVAALVRTATRVLESGMGTVWVEGEAASVSAPSSGHVYFVLKDKRAQVRAVLWRSDARRLRFRVQEGMHLRCRGHLGIYERDGKFQLYVQWAEPAGVGAEAVAMEQLKAKLAAEGLFAAQRKRPLPLLPRRIGVVTSQSGAAIRDIVRAVHRRFPVPILLADARVQGPEAPGHIIRALRALYQTDVDIIIVGRGGGSAADLSAFNHEAVVRAIADSRVPTISAVGHEADITLSDLVADHRAATPTMAGEMAVPVRAALVETIVKEQRRLDREVKLALRAARQEIDQLEARAKHVVAVAIGGKRRRSAELAGRLESQHPRVRLERHRACVRQLEAHTEAAIVRRLDRAARAFTSLASKLEALSPLQVLERGYAIATTSDDHVVVDARAVSPGAPVSVRLGRGVLDCRVERVRDGE